MNACMSNAGHHRLAELDPFGLKLTVDTEATSCKRTVAAREKPADGAGGRVEFGCVDWYRYPDQWGEIPVEH